MREIRHQAALIRYQQARKAVFDFRGWTLCVPSETSIAWQN